MDTNPLRFLFVLLFVALAGCQTVEQRPAIDLSELTVAKIHKAYQEGSYNSRELVAAYQERIDRLDTALNAITYINPDALERAQMLDEEYQRTGKLRPLHGIPMIVKDNFNTRGLPTTGGSLALQNFIPATNAFMIDRLLDAGAIILAKSNMAEWAFSPMHTFSSTFGMTHNPYDTSRVPAGSSGGSGAAVAANLGAIGLGTDTGNSIRGPSSHCCLVGFRSTLGLTSRSGIIPLYLRNDVAGPMCRTVEDATRVLEVIAGYDADDPVTSHSRGQIPEGYQQFLKKDGLQGARIGVLRALSDDDPDPEIQALFEKALADMDSLGATIVDTVDVPDFSDLRKNQWCSDFREDIETYLQTYVPGDTMQTLEDIIEAGTRSDYVAQRLEYFARHSGRSQNPEIACLDPYEDVRRIAFREAIEERMDELKLDAIVYPTWNHKPAGIDSFQADYKGDNSQVIAPHTGQPAFTVPMGFSGQHLPAGLQFLGRMFDEPTLIRLTYAYEQGTLHRRPPKVGNR